MTAFRIHLRKSLFVLVAPALAVAGSLFVWWNAYPQVASQANITNGVGSTIAVLAPVLAGFAAWDALRERRNGAGPIIDAAARSSARDALARLAVAECAAVFVFLIVVAVAYVRAAGFAVSRPPLWMNLLVFLLVLGLSAAVGILSASWIRHWAAVIVAALPPAMVYANAILVRGTGLAQSLNPFGNRAGGDFLVPNMPFFLGQAMFLGGLLLLVVGLILVASQRDLWPGVVVTVCSLALIVSGIAMVNAQHQRWGLPLTDPASRLIEAESADGKLTLAFLPEYRPVQGDLVERWSRVQSILAETPVAFDRLEQLTDSHPAIGNSAEPLRALYLNPASPTVATDSVLESLIDLHTPACERSRTFETSLVELWLAGPEAERQARLSQEHMEALDRLRDLDDDAAREWMSGVFDRFASCEITLSELPPAS